MPVEYICAFMVQQLYGYASKSYITESLDARYKQVYNTNNNLLGEQSYIGQIDANTILEDPSVKRDAEVAKRHNIDPKVDKPLKPDYHNLRDENKQLQQYNERHQND